MPTSVDERVVRMQFDNAQFEQKMRGTMSLLDKFENKLEFKNASKGLEEVQRAANKVDLSNLEDAADKVAVKFDLMSTIVVTQINKMVDSAVEAGKRMAKSLTLDQVTAGFDKYTQKTEAVQSIMNATGRSIEDVNNALEKLQWFSDETSYSFTDMTSNVAKFTSQGVELNQAVSAMEGIALAAADAGANSQNAAHAMYNLSQALSRGYVMREDWKSVETANMVTTTLKETLADAAVAVGTLEKTMNGYKVVGGKFEGSANELFNDALKEGWLNVAALNKGLSEYSSYADKIYEVSDAFDTCSDAMAATSAEGMELGERALKAGQQARSFKDAVEATKDAVSSGWMRTFEIIFGNFNESVELWTDFTNALWDIFASGAEGRNELLKGGLMSGWNQFMETGIKDSEKLKSVLMEVGEEADENFSEMVEAAGGFEKSLSNGWLTADKLALGIDKIITEIRTLDKEQLINKGYTQDSIDSFVDLYHSVEDGSVSLKEFADLMAKPSGRENLISAAKSAFEALNEVIEPVKAALRELFPPVTVNQIYNMTLAIKNFCDGLRVSEKAAITLQAIFKLMLLPVKAFVALLKVAIVWVGAFITIIWKVADAVFSFMAEAGAVNRVLKQIFGEERYARLAEAWSKITEKLRKVFEKLGGAISNIGDLVVNKIGPKISKILNGIWNFVSPLVDKILDGIVDAVEWIADFSFEELFAQIKSFFDMLAQRFPRITAFIKQAYGTIKEFFNWLSNVTIMDVLYAIRDAFVEVTTAVWGFLKAIDFKDIWDKVLDTLGPAITMLKKIANAVLNFVKTLSPAKVLVFAFGVALVALMMNISGLAEAFSGLVKSLTTAITKIISAFKISPILQIAGAIVVLAGALVTLAMVDPKGLMAACAAIIVVAATLGILGAINKSIAKFVAGAKQNAAGFKNVVASMAIMAASITALALAMSAVKNIDALDMAEKMVILTSGIIALELVMVMISNFATKFEAGIKDAIGMGLVLAALVGVFAVLARLKVRDITTALAGMTSIVLSLVVISNLTKGVKFSNGLGMIGAVLGLLGLIGVLKVLAKQPINELKTGLINLQPLMGALFEISVALRIAGSAAKGSGGAIFSITIMFYGLVGLLYLIDDVSDDMLSRGLSVVGVMSAIIGALLLCLKSLVSENRIAKGTSATIISLTVAVGALSLIMSLVGNLDWGTIKRGLTVVGGISAVIAIFIKVAQSAQEAKGMIFSVTFLVGVLSAAIALISLIDWQSSLPAAIGIGVAIAAVGAAAAGIKNVNWKAAIPAAVSMALMIAAITLAIEELSKLNPEASIPSAIALGTVLVAVGLAMALGSSAGLTTSNLKEFNNMAKQLYLAMGAIVLALIPLSYFGNVNGMVNGALGIGIALNALALAVRVFSKANLSKDNVTEFKRMAFELTDAVIVVGAALLVLSHFDPIGVIGAATGLGIAMNLLAVAVNGLMRAGFTEAKVKNLNDMMVTLAVLVGTMGVIMALMSGVAKSPGTLLAAGTAMGIAVNALSVAIILLQKSGLTKPRVTNANNLMGGMIGFTTAAGLLIALISGINDDWKIVLASSTALSEVLLALSVAIKIMSRSEFKKTKEMIGEAVTLGALLAAISGCLIWLSKMDTENAIANATALGIAINAVSFATNLLHSDGLNLKEAFSVAIELGSVILAVGTAMDFINDVDPSNNIGAAVALSVLVLALTLSLGAFKKFGLNFKSAMSGIGAFMAFVALMAGLVTGLGALAGLGDVRTSFEAGCDILLELFAALAPNLIVAMVFLGVLAELGKAGAKLIQAAFYGAVGFDAVVLIVGVLVAALGAIITYVEESRGILESGVEAFGLLGDAIGAFFGHIVGAFISGSTSGLDEAAQNVSDFIEQVTPALEIFASAQLGTAAQNLKDLGAAMLELVGGDILTALTGDSDPLDTFGEELEGLAGHLGVFMTSISGLEVDQTKIDNAIAAAKGLADFASQLPKEGGFWQDIAGQAKSITEFANDIVGGVADENGNHGTSLADALTRFCGILRLGNFDPDIVDKAANSAKALADFASNLPVTGGTWQGFAGEVKSITEFANDLVGGIADENGNHGTSLADALTRFCSVLRLGNFDPDIVDKAANSAKLLANFASNLPVKGGTWAGFAGETEDITDFANDLVGAGSHSTSLAAALVSFSNTISSGNFSEDMVEKGVNAASLLSDFAGELGREGGIFDKVAGKKISLGQFGRDLDDFGEGFSAFYASIKDVDTTLITDSISILQSVWDFAAGINDTDYDKDEGYTLRDMGEDMYKFSEKLVDFDTNVKSVDLERAKTVIDVVNTLAAATQAIDTTGGLSIAVWSTSLSGIAQAGIDAFVTEWSGSSEDVTKAINGFIMQFNSGMIFRSASVFPTLAATVVQTWYDDVIDAVNTATGTTEIVTNAISNTISSMSFDLTNLSGSMITTFSDGLKDYQEALDSSVTTTFSTIPATISSALGNTEGANSTSYDAGVKLLTDLVAGAQSEGEDTNEAFTALGSAAADSFLDGITSIIDDTTDLEASLDTLVKTVCEEINEAFGFNQTHSKLWTIGKQIADGLSIGIKDNQATPANASIKMAENLLKVIQDYLEIHSPSRVMRDEVGAYIVQGIAEGITEDMSAEEAAKKKAENILNAFKDVTADLDNDDSIADLEYKLWEGTNQNATEADKAAKKAEMYETQLKNQGQRVDAAAAAWQATIQQFGEQSEEAQNAYVEYLQAQSTLMDLAQSAADLDASLAEETESDDKLQAYNEYFLAHYNQVEEGMKTEQALWEEAAKATGYGQKQYTKASKYFGTDVKSIMDKYVSDAVNVITPTAEEIEQQIKENTEAATAKGGSDGLEAGLETALKDFATSNDIVIPDLSDYDFDKIAEEVQKEMDAAGLGDLDQMFSMSWSDIFKQIFSLDNWDGSIAGFLNNFTGGLDLGIEKGAQWAIEFAQTCISWIEKTFGIHSPSKVMRQIGQYLLQGLAMGMNDNMGLMDDSLDYMLNSMLGATDVLDGDLNDMLLGENASTIQNALDEAIRQSVQMLENSEAGQPVIRPVLDLSEVRRGLATLNLGSSPQFAMAVNGQFSANKEASTKVQNGSGNQQVINYNFNQTNTSPKALNPSIIYRQSRNLLAQLKMQKT